MNKSRGADTRRTECVESGGWGLPFHKASCRRKRGQCCAETMPGIKHRHSKFVQFTAQAVPYKIQLAFKPFVYLSLSGPIDLNSIEIRKPIIETQRSSKYQYGEILAGYQSSLCALSIKKIKFVQLLLPQKVLSRWPDSVCTVDKPAQFH